MLGGNKNSSPLSLDWSELYKGDGHYGCEQNADLETQGASHLCQVSIDPQWCIEEAQRECI